MTRPFWQPHTFFFSPSAYNSAFHTGAWSAFEEAHRTDQFKCVGGGSAGSLLAFAIAADIPTATFDQVTDEIVEKWSGLKGWGRHTKILGGIIQRFIDASTAPDWNREAFAVITTLEWALPPIGPRIIPAPPITDHKAIYDLVMASCYVPFLYEKVPFWNSVPALDGGVFMMDLPVPGVLNSNPWGTFGPTMLAPLPGKAGSRYMRRYGLRALAPNTSHVRTMREIGYDAATEWLRLYGAV